MLVSLLLVPLGVAGPVYLAAAALLGLGFLGFGVYGLRPTVLGTRWAHRLFAISIVYLMLLQAALLIGIHPVRVLIRHVLPNVVGPVLVIATIHLAVAMLTEATLSFLGLGMPATQPSLGTLIRVGNDFLFSGEWWITIFPGTTLAVLVLAVNLLGDWLRDALNPKLR